MWAGGSGGTCVCTDDGNPQLAKKQQRVMFCRQCCREL